MAGAPPAGSQRMIGLEGESREGRIDEGTPGACRGRRADMYQMVRGRSKVEDRGISRIRGDISWKISCW